MHDHYTKLWSNILESTIWHEDRDLILLWIVLLAKKQKDHVVRVPIPELADKSKLTIERCEECLEKLASPDKYSRTKDFEGRRIRVVDDGILILNGAKYQDHLREEQRKVAVARASRNYRANQRKKLDPNRTVDMRYPNGANE